MLQELKLFETEEYRILRVTAADYAARVIAPVAELLDVEAIALTDTLSKASELGVMRALATEEVGGGGMDLYAFCAALEEMAVESAGVATALLIHNAALMPAIRAGIDLSQIAAAFPLALGYPGKASFAGDTLTGDIPWAFNATIAPLVTVLLPDGAALIETNQDAVTIQPLSSQLGLRAAAAGTIRLQQAQPLTVMASDASVAWEIDRMLHLGFAAISTGIARKGFTTAHAYACQRHQGGDLIIKHQAMRLFLSEMAAGIEMSRAMIRSACETDSLASAIACRLEATERALTSATNAVQVHGGVGYMEDYGMERLMRDASYCRIYPRSNQELQLELLDLLEG
ncbi:MAG: acyl-CoA dehydrogenase family protein [Candidatus Geothermincolia bacterium]